MRARDWDDIRARAARFADEWKGAAYERGDALPFYGGFFRIFGRDRSLVDALERQAARLGEQGRGPVDLLWPGILVVEHGSPGRALDEAAAQAKERLAPLPAGERPRRLLACDFGRFLLVDLERRTESRFGLAELPDRAPLFAFMAVGGGGGPQPRSRGAERPVEARASEAMGRMYALLGRQGCGPPNAGRLLVRLAFCMFAENAGVFGRGAFEEYVRTGTSPDGSDLGPRLAALFEALGTPEDGRPGGLDDGLKAFPHVGGGLFSGMIDVPACSADLRRLVLGSCELDWSRVSPVILGSLLQGAMDTAERHREGAHYTAERDVMRVIGPLFLDGLREELGALLAEGRPGSARRRKGLERFRERLSGLRILDPACGSGNFLIVAYREIRRLELRAIAGLSDGEDRRPDIPSIPRVCAGQFFGIEKDELAAGTAEMGMWMIDHTMDRELCDRLGRAHGRMPARSPARIVLADALEADWDGVLPPERCSYVLGNPPFSGARVMTAGQRRQIRGIAARAGVGRGGNLDYAAGWFLKASLYARGGARVGFVATSSIVQGEQVPELWPAVLGAGLDIVFAHQPFRWGSDAKGSASVSVVIVGLAGGAGGERRRLFYHAGDGAATLEENPACISPYLTGSALPLPLVQIASSALNGLPAMEMGSKAIDGGHYILDDGQRERLLEKEPQAGEFVRPFVGAREFLNGESRWILALHGAGPRRLRAMPGVMKRVRAVRQFRLSSRSRPTRDLAAAPTRYHLNVLPDAEFLVVPRVNAEHREYVPVGYLRPPAIPSDAVMVVRNAGLGLLGLLSSSMHMAWLRRVGGRLGGELRYSKGMVYDTFPVPPSRTGLGSLVGAAQGVLDARSRHADSTLAGLYDPDAMPADLRAAHRALDRRVDRLYRREPFATDMDRLEFLLARYEEMAARPGGRAAGRQPRRGRRGGAQRIRAPA